MGSASPTPNELRLNLNSFIPVSRVNGPGVRAVVFVQGCTIRCPGCWNQDTWGTSPRTVVSVEEVFSWIMAVRSQISGVTFLGGEPFLQARALAALGRLCREAGLTVLTYSGYTLEFLQSEKAPKGSAELLAVTDTLIDGPYVERLFSPGLVWRGSTNQRIIHLTSAMAAEFAAQPLADFEFHFDQDGRAVFTADQPALIPNLSRLRQDLAELGVELELEFHQEGGSR